MSSPDQQQICDIPTEFVEDFDAPDFETTAVIEWMHEKIPRFGHSNNLAALMIGSEKQQLDYKRGLIATSYAMIWLFVVWSVMLLLLKAMGPDKVGILAGAPPAPDCPPLRKRIYRGLFLFAGCSIIVSSILLSINGVNSLTDSLNSGRQGIDIVQDLLQGGIGLLDDVLDQNAATSEEVQSFLETVNHICPKFRDPLCTDLSNASTCNLEGIIGLENVDVIQSILDHFTQGEESIYYKEIVAVQSDLERMHAVSITVDDKAAKFHWAFWAAMGFSIALAVICFFMIVGEIFQIPQILQSLRSWLVMPTFILFVTCSLIFSSLFVLWSLAVADFCVDSPDNIMLTILNRYEAELSPILVEFATFYISHCPADQIPRELAAQIETLVEVVPFINQFMSILQDNTGAIQSICGLENPDQLVQVAQTVHDQFCSVSLLLKDIRLYFQCENWYPLYQTILVDAACYNGSSGFAWVASTQFVVVFMAMVLLTLRGILYDGEVLASKVNEMLSSVGKTINATSSRIIGEHNNKGIAAAETSTGFEVNYRDTSDSSAVEDSGSEEIGLNSYDSDQDFNLPRSLTSASF